MYLKVFLCKIQAYCVKTTMFCKINFLISFANKKNEKGTCILKSLNYVKLLKIIIVSLKSVTLKSSFCACLKMRKLIWIELFSVLIFFFKIFIHSIFCSRQNFLLQCLVLILAVGCSLETKILFVFLYHCPRRNIKKMAWYLNFCNISIKSKSWICTCSVWYLRIHC